MGSRIVIIVFIIVLVLGLCAIGIPIETTHMGNQRGYVYSIDDEVLKGGDKQIGVRSSFESSDTYHCYVREDEKEVLEILWDAMKTRSEVSFWYRMDMVGGLFRGGCYIRDAHIIEED